MELEERVSLKNAEKHIVFGLENTARAYISIGYWLRQIRDEKLYKEAGYQNFDAYVKEKYGKEKSWASRCIKVNQELSEGGNSQELTGKYEKYSIYQLVELAYMNDAQREQATPDQTVKELRDLRKPKEIPYYEIEGQMELTVDFPEVMPEAAEESKVEHPVVMAEEDKPEQQEQNEDWEGVAMSQQMEPQDSMIIQKLFIAAWSEHCPQDFERAMRAMRKGKNTGEKAKKIQEELAQYGCYEILCQEYEFSFHGFKEGMDWRVGDEQIHLEYRRLASELLCMCDPLDDCTLADDEKQVETVPEPIEYDRNVLEKMIQDAKGTLDTMKEGWLKEKPYIYAKYSMMVQAYEMLLQEHNAVDQQPEIEVVEQPELPLLKNNEQRAAFIDAYETWPVWIDNQETGERYYRYDLPNGTSFVVKTYHMLTLRGWTGESGRHYEEGWGCDEQYILEPGKFFKNCWSNRSAMIEKLKEIQKTKLFKK